MASRIVFVDEQDIDEVFGGEDSDLDEQTSEEAKGKVTGAMKRMKAKKKAKKTTGLLAALTREGSTSQVIRAFVCSFQRIHRSRTSFISSSLITYLMR